MSDERQTPAPSPMPGPSLIEGAPERPDGAAPSDTAEVARRRGFRLRGRSLREHVARGTLINGAFMIGLSGLGLLRGFVLAAFLTRVDYGIWGIVIVTLGTLVSLKQVGVGDKYIQQDEDDQELAFQKAFTLEVALTAAFMALMVALIPIVAAVYGEPELITPGLVILAVLPAGVLQIPIWTYYRRMEFVKQRSLLAIEPVVAFFVSVGLAIAGAGYWSLVIGMVVGAWAAAGVALIVSPYRLRLRWDSRTVRSYAGFSWPLFVVSLGSLAIAQGSFFLTDAFLGLAGAGAVALAATITQFTQRVDGLITNTLYPAVSAVRERIDLLHESFVKSNRLALMWAVPFGVALSLFCSDLVSFGIGEEWRPAVVVLQVFGVAAAVGHIGFNWDAYFRARGDTKPLAAASVVAAVVFLASVVPLLSAYGLDGFAAAIALQTVAHVACRAYYLGRLFKGFDFLAHALRSFAPTVPAAAAVLVARAVEGGQRSLAMALAELLVYVMVTLGATLALERPLLREALGYLRARPPASAKA
jgi:O-antigen/teichoic acid export membrane protein